MKVKEEELKEIIKIGRKKKKEEKNVKMGKEFQG